MAARSVADIEGAWVDPQWDSGVIERCRRYWTTPITEVPDMALITYLHQQFAPELVIAEARSRVSAGRFDDTELYDGQLAEALLKMTQHRVSIASPPDRRKLVAMIDFGDEQWAEINQETSDVQIELYPRRDGQPWVFRLADAMAAIQAAQNRLVAREQ